MIIAPESQVVSNQAELPTEAELFAQTHRQRKILEDMLSQALGEKNRCMLFLRKSLYEDGQ